MINFYRRFFPNLAAKLSPLTDTLRKISPNAICWTEELNESFANLKTEFVNAVSLHIPVKDCTFILQTDACDSGIAAVLMQLVEGVEYPIRFISRKLNNPEKKYSIIEKECLAIVWSVKKLHEYLYGRKFIVKTDHMPLQWLTDNKDLCSRRVRWSLALQPYSFTVKYIKGKDNTVPDVLSRYPG